MPESCSNVRVGRYFRSLCGKLILDKCGSNVNIEKGAVFASNVELGDNSGLGIDCRISGKVVIGNDVMMGPGVMMFTRNHSYRSTEMPMNQQGFSSEKPIIIHDDVWIGGRVTILPGVEIGKGAIIGAASLITKNVPAYAIVGGNPARVIKYRNE